MSRGGRGGGFGRGGGGGGAQSGAMQLVSFDLLKDLGSGNLFNVNTALFPEMDVPIPRKPTSNEVQEWKLKKEYLAMVKESPFHLTPAPPPPDIERYSDKYKVQVEKRSLRDIETNLDFFPEELQTILDPRQQKARTAIDEYGQIQALLDAEVKDDEEDNDENKEKEEEEGENEEEYEDEEELFDENDYVETYFDNGEGDDDDDGDGEDAYS
ncbi:DNA-directed RNA polymerase III, subunit Rpc31 [Cokeromyces recurvatus]|uniref:DNA-directed RNA polymerase III, subunit Rpc31 n=1 Tax=Cokeromyces recurvatus TaxID=90255 RepID=UPI00221F8E91|nr:DNA-directed RNA polymerase III, subunit Rpc31 [Cokeromyces recurvatus]KAI7903231.1 DNA-directed RNA polymerase III, subunit Rpc31 [Cokeromyces recurvatus]